MSIVSKLDFCMSKVYVIRGQKIAMVDTGCGVDEEEYRKIFAEAGINPEQVKLIIITHGHWDHCASAKRLKSLTGAPVLCHKNAAEPLRTGTRPEFQPRGEMGAQYIAGLSQFPVFLLEPMEPDILVGNEDMDLTPYGIPGKVIYTPGHDDSSISVMLETGEAIIGDLVMHNVFEGWQPCLSLIATDEKTLRESIRRLAGSSEVFHGGHGGPYDRATLEGLLTE